MEESYMQFARTSTSGTRPEKTGTDVTSLQVRTALALLLIASVAHAQTTRNNDASCDISVTPAATLLIPYFEVDIDAANRAATTIFSVVNTSSSPQIASITIWTDWAYPVLTFDTWLTGYDVASINLYDILNGGTLPSTNGATAPGARSRLTNPQFSDGARAICFPLGGPIPSDLLADVRSGLTTGVYSLCPGDRIGGRHFNAIGYITIDVVATCAPTLPTEEAYYTRELLFDNVLIGDYMQISPNPVTGNYAGASPMVHIRAVPEGGNAGESIYTNLPYTFYDRYTPRSTRTVDRRQPLPSTFAARYIQGGSSGFATDFLVWREGINGPDATCDSRIDDETIPIVEIVRFDERENPTIAIPGCGGFPECRPTVIARPATSRRPSTSSIYPPLTSGDIAGWMYMNITNGGSKAYSVAPGRIFSGANPRPSQNWVVVAMAAEGRYSTLADAATLGNGCSTATPVTSPTNPIGPAPNATP